MSTLKKTIGLLETLPDNTIEAVYAFVQFIDADAYQMPPEPVSINMDAVQSMLGIAHEYANLDLIKQELAYEFIKRLVMAWDPDYTKLTPNELKRLEAAENGEYINAEDINWDE